MAAAALPPTTRAKLDFPAAAEASPPAWAPAGKENLLPAAAPSTPTAGFAAEKENLLPAAAPSTPTAGFAVKAVADTCHLTDHSKHSKIDPQTIVAYWRSLGGYEQIIYAKSFVNHILCLCPMVLDVVCCLERISAISCFGPKSCAFFKSKFLDDESTE
jgi:hypothetical protein